MVPAVLREVNGRGRALAEAAGWRVALSEAALDTSAAFESWLAASPANARAWSEMQAVWEKFGEYALAPDVVAARRDALEQASRLQRRRLRAGSVRWPAAALAAAVAAGALAAGVVWYVQKPEVYQTGLGERRVVTLADGSRVSLDSASLVEVRFLRDARELRLVRGQARFDVAHDVSRPFSVRARDQMVIATGTSFNVDLMGSKVLVTLIEGKVSIVQDQRATVPAGGGAPRKVLAQLVSGQELVTVDPDKPAATEASVVTAANLASATAWQDGQLIFDDEPLSSVVERVGRYASYPLTTAGPAGDLRVSGVFNAGDVATFVDSIQRAFPVQAQRQGDGRVIITMKTS